MEMRYLIPFFLYLTANAIRLIYEILKKAQRVDPKSKILFMLILLVMCLMWVSWFAMCPSDPVDMGLPQVVRWAGLIVFAAGLVLAFGALFQLKGVENIDHLVTKGLFARLRHPMYMGFIFWIIGWAVYNSAGLSLIAGLAGIGNILYWRYLEEEHLKSTYGEIFLSYRAQTWF